MSLFKVVAVDGYARETVADRVVEENLPYIEAEALCKALRDASTWEGDWWEVKPQSSHVWRGMAEFV